MAINSVSWGTNKVLFPLLITGVLAWGSYKIPRYISQWTKNHPTQSIALILNKINECFENISPSLKRYVLVTLVENGYLPTLVCLKYLSKAEWKNPKEVAAAFVFVLTTSKSLEMLRILSAFTLKAAHAGGASSIIKPRDVHIFSTGEFLRELRLPTSSYCFFCRINDKL